MHVHGVCSWPATSSPLALLPRHSNPAHRQGDGDHEADLGGDAVPEEAEAQDHEAQHGAHEGPCPGLLGHDAQVVAGLDVAQGQRPASRDWAMVFPGKGRMGSMA